MQMLHLQHFMAVDINTCSTGEPVQDPRAYIIG